MLGVYKYKYEYKYTNNPNPTPNIFIYIYSIYIRKQNLTYRLRLSVPFQKPTGTPSDPLWCCTVSGRTPPPPTPENTTACLLFLLHKTNR